MNEKMKRGLNSIAVAAVIFLISDFVIGFRDYDVFVKTLEYIAAVIGGGCYWIGSNEHL